MASYQCAARVLVDGVVNLLQQRRLLFLSPPVWFGQQLLQERERVLGLRQDDLLHHTREHGRDLALLDVVQLILLDGVVGHGEHLT